MGIQSSKDKQQRKSKNQIGSLHLNFVYFVYFLVYIFIFIHVFILCVCVFGQETSTCSNLFVLLKYNPVV